MRPAAPAATPRDLAWLCRQASEIAWRLHDEDPVAVWAELAGMDRLRLEQIACVLAAMVDVDQSTRDLLAWARKPAARLREVG